MINFLKKIPKFIRDSFFILLITLLTGFLLYYFSGSGFSFKETSPGESDKKEVPVISIDETKSVLDHGNVLFVDSRSKNYYEKSHIKNAVNIPADSHLDYSFDFLSDYPDKTVKIIVYCDGKTCDSSHITAGFLKDLGYVDVNILINGWSLWKENHLPVFSTEN
ncbi:MAG: rhodanese-like domain-containing protein [Desulfobacteraceae bacterium]|nr:rhodanese-like domain-containing protein [Desulfobacteraceae bacterium]